MKPKLHRLFFISCRSVGPGGTSVNFFATDKGIEGVWVNENCPYVDHASHVTADENYRASDGHNVSKLSWEELETALAFAIKKKLFTPTKLHR